MSSPPPFDPYEVLGVSKDAEVEVIKRAHRKLVIKCHPDKIQDEARRLRANDEFHKVQRSYEILSDPVERKRYDNQMRLAELKAEQIRGGGSHSSPRESPRAAPTSSYEVRNGRVYEERVPDGASKFFDDDSRYFDEPRGARKHDGYDRRASESKATEKKKARPVDIKIAATTIFTKERGHEPSHSERRKTRDKERRSAASDKHSSSRPAPYVEDLSDDSDINSYIPPRAEPRRRFEEPSRKIKAESRRSRETRHSRDDSYIDGYEIKNFQSAADYIKNSKGTSHAENDRHPPLTRSSTFYYEIEPVGGRRSSAKTRSGFARPTSAGKDRRPSIEIVEPPPSHEPRKPRMPTATSSPANLKVPVDTHGPPLAHRSATTPYTRESRREMPSMRRAETSPMTSTRHNESMPSKSSKLRHAETHDSGYSSPGTPEMHQGSSPPKSTKYLVVNDNEHEYPRGVRTVLVDPPYSTPHRSTRSPSPHSRRPERPTVSTRNLNASSRSNTYNLSPDSVSAPRPSMPRHETTPRSGPPRPPLTRNNSGPRRGGPLFGEVEPEPVYKPRYSDEQIRYTKSYGPEHVNYGPYERRGSSGHLPRDRDAYPYRSSHDHPPTFERSSTTAY